MMAGNIYFQFKQFNIIHEKSAMKVGTDGVLLGAWANVAHVKNILDIGTGTGVIAIMLAQRCDAQITAIEIEKNAAQEAKLNVANSPWKNRIRVDNMAFQEFAVNTKQKFDLIVSNPPYFENGSKKKNINQTIARHTDFLSFTELISGVVKLLNSNGKFSVVLPYATSDEIIKIARSKGLVLIRKTDVKPKISKLANRCLLEFSPFENHLETDELMIYNNEGTDYSAAYKALTKDFYLKF